MQIFFFYTLLHIISTFLSYINILTTENDNIRNVFFFSLNYYLPKTFKMKFYDQKLKINYNLRKIFYANLF
jgi:hypothetical protein